MNTTLQFRVDRKMKSEASKIFKSMGLDMSTGMKLFLAQVVNTKSIPFPVMSADFWPEKKKQELVRIAEETLRDYKSGKIKGYDDVEKMHREILGK
ncbi:MAG: type II toxin-antitoxin system RelB/DinJ family antitoxin [Candidatus Yonathbacteria bacterium]|nr:type II toxin-antitoxin system RelB/DinJ family antitoxin [Candidatus Yonathbacteria bacterium]